MSTTAQGTRFELQVAELLRDLGYKVTRDELIGGAQTDLVASPAELSVLPRPLLVVECKDEKGNVDVGAVNGIHARATAALRQKGLNYEPVVVARVGFTRFAKKQAEILGVRLLTFDALASESFDAMTYESAVVAEYEQSGLASQYIELSCQTEERCTIYKPVENFLDKYFGATQRPGAVVLGDFGTGKTSLCQHYTFLLCARRRVPVPLGDEGPICLYFPLRAIRTFDGLTHTLFDSLQTRFSVRGTPLGFESWLRRNRAIIALDGFDEMAARFDRDRVRKELVSLERWQQRHDVRLLITCRTHFFKHQLEEQAFGLMRLYVCQWGSAEVEAYTRKKCGNSYSSAIEQIRNTYNLEELAKTPIFLDMILQRIHELGDRVNRAQLYAVYTNEWIESQDKRAELEPEEKLALMQRLALEMFRLDVLVVNCSRLRNLIREMFHITDRATLHIVDNDVRTCTFLVREDDESYRYIHKSFMEFFVASSIAMSLKEQRLDCLQGSVITSEIAGFTACYFEGQQDDLCEWLEKSESGIERVGLAMILGYAPRTDMVDVALLLAFQAEQDFAHRRKILRALLRCPTEQLLEDLCGLLLYNDENLDVFLEVAQSTGYRPAATLASACLRRGDSPQAQATAITGAHLWSTDSSFWSALDWYAAQRTWVFANHQGLVRSLCQSILMLGDTDLILQLSRTYGGVKKPPEDVEAILHAEFFPKARLRVWPHVKAEVATARRRGMQRSRLEGGVHRRFGRLVDESLLKRELERVFERGG